MKLEEIKSAVRSGLRVFWVNRGYEVKLCRYPSGEEQWLVIYEPNGYAVGLTRADGVTMNEPEDKFFIAS